MQQPIFKERKESRTFEIRQFDEQNRTVELSFSSEEPYARFWGIEILDHSISSMDTTRLMRAAPLLLDHDITKQIGVVDSVGIVDGKGRATVRFGRSALANEVFLDVTDGIRRNVSVGYQIKDGVCEGTDSDGNEIWRITRWEPFEISIVSVPADTTVGVGRSMQTEEEKRATVIVVETGCENENQEEDDMDETVPPTETAACTTDTTKKSADTVDVRAVESRAVAARQNEIKEMQAIGKQFNVRDMADEAIASSKSLEIFRSEVLRKMGEGQAPINPMSGGAIGMTDKEVRKYSMLRAIRALANPNDRGAQEAAAFEFEVSAAAIKQTGKTDRGGLSIPSDILTRAMSVGVAADGGATVAHDLLSGSFIDMLRNNSLMMGLSTHLTGLTGFVDIPRQTSGATAYWLAENGTPTGSMAGFDQLALSPKTISAYTELTRRLLLQSSIDMEMFVRRDLAMALALGIDLAAIAGTGLNNQPTGILNTTGIGLVALGANGDVPASDHIIDLETAVATSNADIGNLKYIGNAKVRGKLKKTGYDTNKVSRVWDTDNTMNGYDALATNQVPSDLTKGTGTNLSALLFGNFSDLIIAMWSGMDITVDPYIKDANGRPTGGIGISIFQDADIAVRHAASFAAIKDMVTA